MEEAWSALEDLRAPPKRRRATEEAAHTQEEGKGKAWTPAEHMSKGGFDMGQTLFNSVPTRNRYFLLDMVKNHKIPC